VLCALAPALRGVTGDIADAMGVPGVLMHDRDEHVWVLVPTPRLSVSSPAGPVARAFVRLSAATGVTVVGSAVADVAGVPDAAEETREILTTAVACGRRGAVLAEDVMVERALTGSTSAVDALARIIPELARFPHLPETLDVLYEHDLDRSGTADALHIARRTLTNRLDRIHRLTGFHPASARGVQIFMSALAADRIARLSATSPDDDRGVG
jgi:PucR C-terminal helix-turn-helix domain